MHEAMFPYTGAVRKIAEAARSATFAGRALEISGEEPPTVDDAIKAAALRYGLTFDRHCFGEPWRREVPWTNIADVNGD